MAQVVKPASKWGKEIAGIGWQRLTRDAGRLITNPSELDPCISNPVVPAGAAELDGLFALQFTRLYR
jgi:hypothetical protein